MADAGPPECRVGEHTHIVCVVLLISLQCVGFRFDCVSRARRRPMHIYMHVMSVLFASSGIINIWFSNVLRSALGNPDRPIKQCAYICPLDGRMDGGPFSISIAAIAQRSTNDRHFIDHFKLIFHRSAEPQRTETRAYDSHFMSTPLPTS